MNRDTLKTEICEKLDNVIEVNRELTSGDLEEVADSLAEFIEDLAEALDEDEEDDASDA